jgi:hypothetical protein
MAKELLSIGDIKRLNKLLRQVFEYINNLRKENDLAVKIKYPQLPSVLSESLAIHLLKKRLIIPELDGFGFYFGGRIADILATKNSKKLKIEVKATAKSAFEYFGEKDISADYILWLHFEDFYTKPRKTNIEIFTVTKPGDYFKKPLKITLSKLRSKVGPSLEKKAININSI